MNPGILRLGLVIGADDQHRQINQVDHLLGDTADIPAAQPARAVRADNEQVNIFGVGKVDDVFRWFSLPELNIQPGLFLHHASSACLWPQASFHPGFHESGLRSHSYTYRPRPYGFASSMDRQDLGFRDKK